MAAKELTPEDIKAETMQQATYTAAGLASIVALGAAAPNAAFSSMLTKFGLASISGYQTVRITVATSRVVACGKCFCSWWCLCCHSMIWTGVWGHSSTAFAPHECHKCHFRLDSRRRYVSLPTMHTLKHTTTAAWQGSCA